MQYLILSLFNIFSSCVYVGRENSLTCWSYENLITSDNPWNFTTLLIGPHGPYSTLRTESFKKHPFITQLTFMDSINKIEKGAFNGLDHLERLEFTKNELPVIKAWTFENLPVERIGLHGAQVNEIEPGTFKHLPNIEELYIVFNSISIIKKGVFSNTRIKNLDVSFNNIDVIEENAFIGMTRLEKLHISDNKLSHFECDNLFGKSLTLNQLSLQNNLFEEINKRSFSGCPELEHIDMHENKLRTITKGSFALTKLKVLQLFKNHLTEIHPDIISSENIITHFLINDNNLTYIAPELISKLSHVKKMSIWNNPWQCPCLEELKSWLNHKNITYGCQVFLGEKQLKEPQCVVENTSKCVYDLKIGQQFIEDNIDILKSSYETCYM